jgi:hypothetical protein
MKKLFAIVMILAATFIVWSGCTDNSRARSFGGSMTEKLPPGEKLVNVTWKETDLWILTRPMQAGETPGTYTFKEKSTYGVMEGTITIVEQAK